MQTWTTVGLSLRVDAGNIDVRARGPVDQPEYRIISIAGVKAPLHTHRADAPTRLWLMATEARAVVGTEIGEKALGRRFLMATSLFQAGPNAIILALLRNPRQGPFEPTDQALLERLRPHLQHVARIHAQLQQAHHETELARDLLDGVSTCLIATDTMACVVRANKAAETMLRIGDALRIVAGRLVAESPAQTETLHRLIRRAAGSGAGDPDDGAGMIIDGRSGGRHGLMVMPLNRCPTFPEKPDRALALVTMSNLDQQTSPGRHLIDMFGLTAAESRLAAEIAAGRRLDVLAEEHRVRMTTLRTQLRAIYGKTGTSRQAELVHLVSRLGTLRGGS
jgi:DNA-binding CsgD family transcriptional regulator